MATVMRKDIVCDVCKKVVPTRRFQVRYPEGFLSYDLCVKDEKPLYEYSKAAGVPPGHRSSRRRVTSEREVEAAKRRPRKKAGAKRVAAAK